MTLLRLLAFAVVVEGFPSYLECPRVIDVGETIMASPAIADASRSWIVERSGVEVKCGGQYVAGESLNVRIDGAATRYIMELTAGGLFDQSDGGCDGYPCSGTRCAKGDLNAPDGTGQVVMAPIDGSDLVIHGAWASEYGAVRVISDCVLTAGPPTVIQVAAANPALTTLVAAIIQSGLVDTLARTGPFTVFAPTNSAFDALPAGTLDALLADIPALTNVLLYHVTSGLNFVKSFSDQQDVPTLQGSVITIDLSIGTQIVFDTGVATVTSADVAASNGLIQIIDTVLIPPVGSTPPPGIAPESESAPVPTVFVGPTPGFAIAPVPTVFVGPTPRPVQAPVETPGGTVVDVAAANPDLGTLIRAINVAGLVDTLARTGPFTVFAPTNSAFDALPAGTLDALLADIPALTNVLLYHVTSGLNFVKSFSDQQDVPTLQGSVITIDLSIGTQIVFDTGVATVTSADVSASNGLVQIIDTVLIPPVGSTPPPGIAPESGSAPVPTVAGPTPGFAIAPVPTVFIGPTPRPVQAPVETVTGSVVDVAAANTDLSTLVRAINVASLVDTLSAVGPFTVFAPTNAAFDFLPAGTLDDLLADIPSLTNVLLYHVTSGVNFVKSFTDQQDVLTLQGSIFTIDLSIGTQIVFDTGVATVTSADVSASNGLIQIIDTVLIPPVGSTPPPGIVPESGSAPVPTVVAGPTPGPVQIPAPTVVAGPTPRPVQAPLGSVGGTVVQVAAANPDLTTLVAAIIDAGLDDTLARTGPFTVFAPTNSAFDSLPTGTLDALLADIPSLTNVLLYHVVSGVNFVKSFTDQQDVLTLQGSVITIDLSIGTQVVFDTGVATVTAADIAASNGLIQIIDTVLIPPTGPTPPPGPVMSNGTSTPTGVGIIGPAVPTPGGAPKPTGLTGGIVSIAGATVDLTTFVAAVDAAGLEDALSAFPLTVFAPVDTAFAALPNGTLDGLLADIPALTDVLLYHVIGQRLFAADFGAGIVFPTLQGSTLSTGSTLTSGASTVAQVIYAGGTANVLVADVLASNGLLHTIDTVMIPPSRGAVEAGSIVDVVGAVASLTTLVSAIEAAGLVDILSGAGSYTLFAPNDGAFESLSIDLLADEAELERILLSHVVAREFLSTDVVDGLIVSTVAGGTLTMHLGTDAVEIQGAIGVATVLTPDIAASNGVVHVIDTVLMPPTPAPALSPVPTLTPAASPSGTPSASPSVAPTSIPTPLVPTEAPTSQPTPMPSPIPTPPPTSRPTPMPSPIPTPPPTSLPTPTTLPTPAPTTPPTRSPSRSPTTWVPTVEPTVTPTTTPSTSTPTVATIRSVTAYRSCFGKGCPLDVLFERLDQADLIVAASLKVEFKGDFGSDSREFVTVDLNGAQVVQGHRPQKWYSECMDDFETCAEFDDVLDLVKNGDIRVQMWASPFVDHPCSDDIFKSKYMMGARFTLTFECPVAADNSEGNAGCFGSLPPSMSPGPTLSPVPTSTLPSPVPTVLSSIGSLIGEGWCSFAGCEVSASFGRLENPGDIIKATLNVDVRGEFSETNEFADLYLNDVKYSNKCGTIDCSDTLDPCTPTEIDVLPIVRGPQGDLVANLKASPAVGDTFLCANENPNYAMRARFTLTFVCSSGVARKDGCYSSSSSPPLKPTTTLPTPAPSVVPTA